MAKIKLAMIAREIELCECQFVTIVIDIVHNSAISVRRKGLIRSMEYFRLISADFTLSYCFSTSAGKAAVLKSGQTAFRVVSTLPVHREPPFRPSFAPKTRLQYQHFCACLGGSAVLVDADSADAIAVGNAVRRHSDDTIIKRNARLQFDIAPQIASDGYGLEQYVVVQADGSDAQAVPVEDQRAGVIQDIKNPQQIEVDVNHEPT